MRVDFSDEQLSGTLEIDAARRTTLHADSDRTDSYRKLAAAELVILRHKDLARFVDMTKGEKLQAMAPLIGLEVLSDVHVQIARALRQMEQDLGDEERALQDLLRNITQTLGSSSAEQMWDAVNQLLVEVGVDKTVRDPVALASVLATVSVAADPERDRRLKNLRSAKDALERIAGLPDEFSSVVAFETSFDALSRDPAALRELQLVDVWEAGLRVISEDWWEGGVCPLCSERVDSGQLQGQIDEHLQMAAVTKRKCEEVEAFRRTARRELDSASGALENALGSIGDVEQCEAVTVAAAALTRALDGLQTAVRRQIAAGAEIGLGPLDEWRGAKARVDSSGQGCLSALTAAIDELSPSSQERSRLDAYRRLSALESDIRRLQTVEQSKGVVERQARVMRRVLERFDLQERRTMAEVLDRISGNVSSYYQRLHGGERYHNVRLEFLPDDRGLEFSLEAHGETITPPRLMLSESHLNSLGLCLFLAAAREFNRETRFLVLDDVVNSFDAEHRAQLAALLVEEFRDFQIIALTHDPIWFDILRRIASDWVVQRITGWSFELGVQIAGDTAQERARIEEFLDRGEEDVAGNLTRQLAERLLKRLCQELRVPVPYREGYENERRTAHELFRALRGHAQPRQRFSNRDHPVWNQFQSSNFLVNLSSHDQPQMATGLSAGDLRYALDRLDEIENIFQCGDCGRWVWQLRSDPNDDRSQCKCGKLEI